MRLLFIFIQKEKTLNFRQKIAEVFHNCVQVEREEIFSKHDPIPISWQDDARLMFPGIVGDEYSKGSVVFMGINPGGGKNTYSAAQRKRYGDDRLYPAMEHFKNATRTDLYNIFNKLNNIAQEVMSNWTIWRYIAKAIKAVDVSNKNFAYLNTVPYRVQENDIGLISEEAFQKAKDLVVSKQIEVLRPKTIIVFGTTTDNIIGHYYRSIAPTYYVVPGTRGWSHITPNAESVFQQIGHDLSGSTITISEKGSATKLLKSKLKTKEINNVKSQSKLKRRTNMARALKGEEDRLDVLRKYEGKEICTPEAFSLTLQAVKKAEVKGQLFPTTSTLAFLEKINFIASAKIVGFDPKNPDRKNTILVIDLTEKQFQALIENKERKNY